MNYFDLWLGHFGVWMTLFIGHFWIVVFGHTFQTDPEKQPVSFKFFDAIVGSSLFAVFSALAHRFIWMMFK